MKDSEHATIDRKKILYIIGIEKNKTTYQSVWLKNASESSIYSDTEYTQKYRDKEISF
jgi:hypothetical protein